MNKKILKIIIIFVAFLALFSLKAIYAQQNSDAIAIRIIANPSHMSALRWYQDQGFSGSPQSLLVDGYEAVRDGRTVYVNVANVDTTDLYTNIYLISYNQEAETPTIDIFGNILSHWTFNTNLTTNSNCRNDNMIPCLKDDECPIGDVCESLKARVTRDTRRLGDLSEAQFYLDEYRANNGIYPTLQAGTYLKNTSISVWPSWQERLADEVNATMPIDPVNELGDCPGYDELTCWNEISNTFATALPTLPPNSLVYFYESALDGSSADICAVIESGLIPMGDPACAVSTCLDMDGDGYGRPGSAVCLYPDWDCDDSDPSPAASVPSPEICSGGVDEDCDGLVDCNDGDCTGDPVCTGICTADGCNGICPSGCTSPLDDPDCGCVSGDTICCAASCSWPGDTDCSPLCTPDGCNGVCPGGCTSPLDDPDCGCTTGDGICCALSCNYLTDQDCPEMCSDNDSDTFNGYDINLCPSGTDCDDTPVTGSSIYPGATEQCNGVDDNCDTQIDETYNAEDCWWRCTNLPIGNPNYNWNDVLPGRTGNRRCCGNDPNEANGGLDYQPQEDNPINYCSDTEDNDCDGLIDVADPDCSGCFGVFTDESLWYIASEDCDQCDYEGDQDGDQTPGNWSLYPGMADLCDADCAHIGAQVSATVDFPDFQLTENRCDGIDNDCDGTVDEGCDDDGDGYCDQAMILWHSNVACPNTPYTVDGAPGDDCDDSVGTGAGINPGIIEDAFTNCNDGIDQNCDSIDPPCAPSCTDADGDLFIQENTLLSLCGNVCGSAANQPCVGNNDCDDTINWIFPGALETCDTYDNNCSDTNHSDGINPADIDEGCDDDNDGYCDDTMQIYNNTSMCTNTVFTVDGMFGNDCDDNAGNVYPGYSPELCDSIDHDCDGDNFNGLGVEDCQAVCVASGYIWTGNGNPLNCCGNDVNEGPVEICGDGIDNNCDTQIDEGCTTWCTFTFPFPCTFP